MRGWATLQVVIGGGPLAEPYLQPSVPSERRQNTQLSIDGGVESTDTSG